MIKGRKKKKKAHKRSYTPEISQIYLNVFLICGKINSLNGKMSFPVLWGLGDSVVDPGIRNHTGDNMESLSHR